MEVFIHHIYEYEKGLRKLILHTTHKNNLKKIEEKLTLKKIAYIIQDIGKDRVNVFLGDKNCINVLRTIGKKSLTYYTDEEDFILGTMLGYDGIQQCQRYIQRKKAKENLNELAG